MRQIVGEFQPDAPKEVVTCHRGAAGTAGSLPSRRISPRLKCVDALQHGTTDFLLGSRRRDILT